MATKNDSEATPLGSDDSEATPSGSALKQVGEPKKNASDEELVEHADKYLAAKLKARRG